MRTTAQVVERRGTARKSTQLPQPRALAVPCTSHDARSFTGLRFLVTQPAASAEMSAAPLPAPFATAFSAVLSDLAAPSSAARNAALPAPFAASAALAAAFTPLRPHFAATAPQPSTGIAAPAESPGS